MRTRELFLVGFILSAVLAHAQNIVQVDTKQGPVIGTVFADGRREFRNIPYADSPVGNLRWKPPTYPPTQFTTTAAKPLNATSSVPLRCCLQGPAVPAAATAAACTGGFSEDCLVSHVYAHKSTGSPNASIPVYIHGGSLLNGAAALYNASQLVTNYEVVVVTINYRVNAYGFLASPDLAADAGSAGMNYGIQDSIAALRWVKDNIAAFGGDPARVTVFGESAGSSVVGWLFLIPQAQGLFSHAIMESAAPADHDAFPPSDTPTVLYQYNSALKFFNLTSSSLTPAERVAALRNVSAADLQKWNTGRNLAYLVVDGSVVNGNSFELLHKGDINNISTLVIGDNENEGSKWTVPNAATNYSTTATFLTNLVSVAPSSLATEMYPANWTQEMLDFYFDGKRGDVLTEINAAADLLGDYLYYSGNRYFAQALTNSGINVYKYRFNVTATGTNTTYQAGSGFPVGALQGVYHGSELPYVFQWATLTNTSDVLTAKDMSAAWTSVAIHSGDPDATYTGNVTWPKYTLPERELLVFLPSGVRRVVNEQNLTTYRQQGNELIEGCE
ncbi:hypothetical protein HDU93_001549 [Gonapodya sp. JEL0774]|nr:hypothetical protein HDU93_001549 [Gonapodya sp. JEL0774]